MGGVAGHLAHLYDNRDLTYNKMAEILQKAAKGELIGTEKTDGYNIYLGFVDGRARAARNKGDMSRGGMTMEDLVNREFRGGEKSKKAYVTAFAAYEKALNSLSDEEKAQIFGPAGEIFYNTEIQGPIAPNVVNYDENVLNIHHMGHKKYNKDANTLEVVDHEEQSKYLDAVVDRFEQATANEPFSVRRTAFLNLNHITDEQLINNVLDRIQASGYSGNMTINDYLESKLYPMVEKDLPQLDENKRQLLIDRMLKKEGAPTTPQITKGMPKEDKQIVSQYNKNSKFIIKKLIEPIELAIHDLAVELLRGLKSAYILDNRKEVDRLKEETAEAIKAIQSYEGEGQEAARDILVQQIAKLKHHDNIDTVVEGFAFQYDGQMYKFTGNFAPMNQLLGLFKYGRGKAPPMVKETILEQNEADNSKEIIAIYPGRFQPMGKHHAKVFKGDEGGAGIQDIYDNAFIATSDAKTKPNSPFTFAQKKKIIEAHGIDPNVIFKVKNPYYAKEITNNYDPETHRVVYLVGAKDMAENPRFAKTEGITKEGFDWSIEVAPHVSIEIPEYGEMCGTTCRLALKDATEEEFETIMGFKNPEVYEMIKNRLNGIVQENTQHFLGIFRGLADEVLLEEGFFKSKEEKVLDKVQKDFNLTLQSNWTKPPHQRKRWAWNPDVKRVRQWIELGATSTMINQIFTLMYYGELKLKNGINRIYYSVPSQTIKDPHHSNSIFTKIRVEKRMSAGKELWDARTDLLSKEPMAPIMFNREHAPRNARYISGAKVDIDAVNYYKSLGLKLKDIIEKDSPMGGKRLYPGHGTPDPVASKQPGARIRRTSDELYKKELAIAKTWQEFVALNNYPPAVEIINDKFVESEKSKNARKDHLENVVHKALPLSMPLEVVKSGEFDSWIKGAGARYGGGLSLATPKGEKGALSVADRPGELSLAEKRKQLEEEEELEEHGLAGYAGPVGRPRRRKIKEQEVNEALNYLLQKLGV